MYYCLSRRAFEAFKSLTEVEADPDAAYQAFRARFAAYDTYGSAAAFVEERRRRASRPYRGFYVRYIQITDSGRLTVARASELTALATGPEGAEALAAVEAQGPLAKHGEIGGGHTRDSVSTSDPVSETPGRRSMFSPSKGARPRGRATRVFAANEKCVPPTNRKEGRHVRQTEPVWRLERILRGRTPVARHSAEAPAACGDGGGAGGALPEGVPEELLSGLQAPGKTFVAACGPNIPCWARAIVRSCDRPASWLTTAKVRSRRARGRPRLGCCRR